MKPLAITQGDPAGIGPEIVAKAFRDAPADLVGCFVVGDVATLRRAAQAIVRPGVPMVPVAQIAAPADVLDVPPRCVPVLQLPGIPGPQPWGQVSAAAGRAAADSVVWAARAALRGEWRGWSRGPCTRRPWRQRAWHFRPHRAAAGRGRRAPGGIAGANARAHDARQRRAAYGAGQYPHVAA